MRKESYEPKSRRRKTDNPTRRLTRPQPRAKLERSWEAIVGVMFDVDGTLVDSNGWHVEAFQRAFEATGRTVAKEAIRRKIGMGGGDLVASLLRVAPRSEIVVRVNRMKAMFFHKEYLRRVRPFPMVRDLVESLQRSGFQLAVASSAKEAELAALLGQGELDDLFPIRTCSDDVKKAKPAPDIVQATLARMKLRPEQAVLVGDTPYDIEAGRRAGVSVIALESGGWKRKELRGALSVYGDPAHFLSWLMKRRLSLKAA